MQIKVCRYEDGPAVIEVIDSSDGAVAHRIEVNAGQEVTLSALTADSPADIEVGAVCEIGEAAEADRARGQGTEGEEALSSGETTTPQPSGTAPGGEESADDPDPAAA